MTENRDPGVEKDKVAIRIRQLVASN
jgi:hypothetical protein